MIVDVHHHFLPEKIFRLFSSQTDARRLEGQGISITLNEKLFIIEEHLKDMEASEIDTAVLSYAALSNLGPEICTTINDALYGITKHHGEKFSGCAHLPGDPDEGLKELQRCYEDLGFLTVCLPTGYSGRSLDDPSLFAYYDYIQKQGMTVIVHPNLKPQVTSSSSPAVGRSIGRAFEITESILLLIIKVLPKFPSLKIIMPHLGGAFPFLKGRFAMFYEPGEIKIPGPIKDMAKTQSESSSLGINEYLKQITEKIYVDTAGSGAWSPAIRLSLEVLGEENLIFGTDYPLECKDADNIKEYRACIDSFPLSTTQKENIYSKNFLRLSEK